MRPNALAVFLCATLTWAQQPAPPAAEKAPDPIAKMVSRLNLEAYKATIKSLTQFGDRRQGTDRNRQAIDWIETQLKSYGCANIERLEYSYQPPGPDTRPSRPYTSMGPGLPTPPDAKSVGGGRPRGLRTLVG